MRSQAIKRSIDIAGAALGLLVAMPVLVLAMIAVRLTLGAPVLFRQERGGYKGRIFWIYKLRTLSNQPASDKISFIGRLLRRTSIDEIPQLWNVLKGDMSLVGPRPLLASYLDRYDAFQARRHHVKPGITGVAQLQGRNAVDWQRRFDLDVWYVEHWTIALDIRLLARTFLQWFRWQPASAGEYDIIPEFRGTQREDIGR
jgi:lipopolysaccharide/colanic/teichoic acid biosynthesis glycosyltransferase